MANDKLRRFSYYSALAWVDSCSVLFNSDKNYIIDLLSPYGYEMFLSPIHDNDFNSDGSNKKHHRHIIIKFPYAVDNNIARKEIESFGFQFGLPCKSFQGCLQYFIHKNNPDKAQYKLEDCIFINVDTQLIIKKYFSSDILDTDIFCTILDIINSYNIKTIKQLIDVIILDYRDYDYVFKYVVKNCYFIEKYLKGGY